MASPLRRPAAGIGLAVLIAFVLPGLVRGGALYLRDINMVWLPQVESFVRGVAAGSWPLWDTYSGLGRPLLADPRAEILYPPTWLNLVLRPATYYALFTVAHLALAGAGMARLARRDGLGPVASATAAGVWTAGGPLLSLVSMWHHLAAAAWLPWVVLAFDGLVPRTSARTVAWAAAALAVQVVAGSPDLTALTALIVVVRLLPILARERADRGPRLAALAASAALGLGLSAAQWLPTLDVVRRSARWAAAGGATTWSLHPLALVELVLPARWADLSLTAGATLALLEGKEPWMRSVYLGAAAAALVAAGLATPRPRRGTLALLLVAGVGLALGPHAPLYAIVAVLPGANALRFPVKALLVASFAWSLLAGAGVEALGEGTRRARAAAMATAAAMGALEMAAWMALGASTAGRGVLGPLLAAAAPVWVRPPLATSAAIAAAVAMALWLGGRRVPYAAIAASVALLAVADLAWRHRELNPTAPRALFAYRPAVLDAIGASDDTRLYVYDYSMDPGVPVRAPRRWPYRLARVPEGWTPSASLVLGVHAYLNPPTAARWGVLGSYDLDILGFDAVPVDRLTHRLREVEGTPAHLRLLQIGAVSRVLALEPAAWWRDLVAVGEVPGFFADPIHIFRVPDPLPRAYAVDGVRVARGEAALFALEDPGFDPRREVVLEQGTPHPPAPGMAGTVLLTRTGADVLEASVDMGRDGQLVLVDAYDPGWRATVDGRPVTVARANVAFRAVAVPAGRHRVRLAYRPPAVLIGLVVSAVAVAGVSLLGRLAGRPEPC